MPLTIRSSETKGTLKSVVTESVKLKHFSANLDCLVLWIVVNNLTSFCLLFPCSVRNVQSYHRSLENCVIITPLVHVVPDGKSQSARTRSSQDVFFESRHRHDFLGSKIIISVTIILKDKVFPVINGLMFWSCCDDTWGNSWPVQAFKTCVQIHDSVQKFK